MKRFLMLVLLAGVVASLPACKPAAGKAIAANAPNDTASLDMPRLVQTLSARLGHQIDAKQIAATRMAGLYEVQLGSEIIYTDAKGELFFVGELVDASTRENLTRARVAELTRVDFNKLPLELAHKHVKGKGERSLAIFADPNCGYCKRLENTLASVDNITIYTFFMPVLGDDSVLKARQIWCAQDRQQVWDGWMLRGQRPMGAGDCATPIDAVLAFADKQGIKGTPALFFADGTRHPGALQLAELEAQLTSSQARAAQKN